MNYVDVVFCMFRAMNRSHTIETPRKGGLKMVTSGDIIPHVPKGRGLGINRKSLQINFSFRLDYSKVYQK